MGKSTLFPLLLSLAWQAAVATCYSQSAIINRQLYGIIVSPDDEVFDGNITPNDYLMVVDAIGSALEEKGYRVKDLAGMVQLSDLKHELQEGTRSNQHFKALAENAMEDIKVTVKLAINKYGNDAQISIRLMANDGYTGDLLATDDWCRSTRRRWPDLYSPTMEALRLNSCIDSFVAKIDRSILELEMNGRPIDVQIESQNSGLILNKRIPRIGQSLNEAFLDCLRQHAVNGAVRSVASNAGLSRFEIHIPSNEQSGKHITPLEIGHEMIAYIESIFQKMEVQIPQISLKIIGSVIMIYIE